MVMNAQIAAEQVAAGGKWMDAHAPRNWYDFPDLDTLDISRADLCVLGQVFKGLSVDGFGYALNTFGLGLEVCNLGFNYRADYTDPHDSFEWGCAALTSAWREYILERRAADVRNRKTAAEVARQEPWAAPEPVVSLGQAQRGQLVPA
jgi:hypothetical protein